MRPSVVLAYLLLAACTYEPDLLECGDLICPPHSTCLVDRCVTPAQLASCVDKAPDEPCAVEASVGVCVNGACTYVGCGNGVVDPTEACDDANTTFGDGCSADCRSNEVCGNGIVDYSLGETCDCGANDAARPERCSTPNSDDPASECSPACELRFCGDAELNALEQCDGEMIGDAVCADFGYYHGAPTCSAGCLLEVDGCYGRCGDFDIEPAFGEFCDGTAPVGSCVTYGFDAGLPACSAACSPDFSQCERFGLVQHEARAVIAFELQNGVPLVLGAAAESGSNAWAVINGVRILAPEGNYTALVNDGARVIAVSSGHLAVWNQTAWVIEAAGWPATQTPPSGAWASAQLGLFVAIDGALWRRTTTWAQQTPTGIVGVTGHEDTVFAWSTTQAWSSTSGGAYANEPLPTIGSGTLRFVGHTATGPRWVISTNGAVTSIHGNSSGTWQSQSILARSASLDLDGNLLIATQGGPYVARMPLFMSRVSSALDVNAVTRTPDGGLAFATGAGAVSQRTGAWDERDLILSGYAYDPYENDRFQWLDVASDGSSITTSSDNYAAWVGDASDPGHYPWDLNYYYVDDASILPGSWLVLLSGGWVTDAGGGGIYDGERYDEDGNYIGSYPIYDLDATTTGAVIASGEAVLVRIVESGSLVTAEPIYTDLSLPDMRYHGAGAGSDGTIVALGFDGQHRIVRVAPDGTPTVLLSGPPMGSIWVSPDGDAIAAGGNLVVRCLASATTCTTETVGMNVNAVDATALDDVFIGGSGATGVFGTISHWDGTSWYAIRTPSTYVNQMMVFGDHIAYVDGGTRVRHLTRLVRW